ncbi:MAG: YdeI/OmpD-associated family protein [Clostridiales bacterium]|nr:YdeI/OmpD-associated family protein [Clostridiales bacterium]
MTNHDQKYQEKSKNKEPAELAKNLLLFIPPHSKILDLGAGAGTDSRFLVDNGHSVTAIDRETTVISEVMESHGGLYSQSISVVKGDFYDMSLPDCDVIYANYSLPFCATSDFLVKWLNLESQVKVGTIVAYIFFGKNDDWKNSTEKFTFHSKEDVESLLDQYEILHIEGKEYNGSSMKPSGEIVEKHWNIIEVIAQKTSQAGKTKTLKSSVTFFEDQDKFRAWLEANHEKETELLVGFYKVGSGKPSMSWSQSVDQALCFGWIDSVRRSIDEESYCIRFTPRKKTSIWSAININKVEELKRLGFMKPAGLKAYGYRTDDKSEIYSHENGRLELELDYEKQFKQDTVAWAFFDSQATSYKKAITHWIMSGKQEKTRQSRLNKLIDASREKKRLT